jgi:hypothetical protein
MMPDQSTFEALMENGGSEVMDRYLDDRGVRAGHQSPLGG